MPAGPERSAPARANDSGRESPGAASPARGGAGGIAAAVALASAPFAGHAGVLAFAAALALVAVASHRRGDVASRNATLLAALALGTVLLPNGWWAWPAPALLATAAALRPAWRGPEGVVAWWRRGTLSAGDLGWIVAVVASSGAALVGWTLLWRPDLSDLTSGLPSVAPWLLLAGGTVWAALNAFGEEALFRGALLDALDRAVGTRVAFVVQALAFGLVHWHGFPRGPVGVALAAAYGVMLGAVRRRTGGLLAPWFAHVFADVVILALLLAAR